MKKSLFSALSLGTVGALALGTVTAATAQDTDANALQSTLDEILADPRLDGSQTSVMAENLSTGELLYDRNGGDRLLPASNLKLFTSAAAMDRLGPDHRFTTDLLHTGAIEGGTVDGDLYLRGEGDPTATAADYRALAADLAAAGVTEVDGDLVADDTAFDREELGAEWAWGDLQYSYGAPVSALNLAAYENNDAGTVQVTVKPGAEGEAAEVALKPATDALRIEGGVTTGPSGDDTAISVNRELGSDTITVSGSIPAGGDAYSASRSVDDPTAYTADVFAKALEAEGITVKGDTRLHEKTPGDATAAAAHESAPLSDVLVTFLKLSKNSYAEHLVKALGKDASGQGTFASGTDAVAAFLKEQGLDTDSYLQVDGSGLSRLDLIPSAEFMKLLKGVQDEPWFDQWQFALPIACDYDLMEGGTLRWRMCGTRAEENATAKTGTMSGATALTGYTTAANGDTISFSIMLNDYLGYAPKDIEDAIVIALSDIGAGDTASAPELRSMATEEAPEYELDIECTWTEPVSC
ncbi:D-alanyl-D-alanine carboxypeptidase/D-alanyl-D-alanine endopeptidase [Salininema proteolyticum]|uniref:D-alanyl-D-alanine carboxypeptidase/D-alanyl-D-alanine-endopeptidase n=1 Tax=Salininema proteolyticum TaxID=1607685 RepID=A0ABV8U3B8_9ACTN